MVVLIINSILLALIIAALVILATKQEMGAFVGILLATMFVLGPLLILSGYFAFIAEAGLVDPGNG